METLNPLTWPGETWIMASAAIIMLVLLFMEIWVEFDVWHTKRKLLKYHEDGNHFGYRDFKDKFDGQEDRTRNV